MAVIDVTGVPGNVQLVNVGTTGVYIPLEGTQTISLQPNQILLVKAETVSGLLGYLAQESNILKVDEGTSVTIVSGEQFTDSSSIGFVQGKNYTFSSCSFQQGLFSSVALGDVSLSNCSLNAGDSGDGGYKDIYLTGANSINISGCTFDGPVTAGTMSTDGYGLDLNIYSNNVSSISITNNTFNVTAGDSKKAVAISIKARLGSTDHPTDLPQQATPGTIGSVNISNNYFYPQCASIYMGTGPKGSDSNANTTTGDFTMTVSNNSTDVSVYERYLYDKNTVCPPVLVKAGTTQTFGQ